MHIRRPWPTAVLAFLVTLAVMPFVPGSAAAASDYAARCPVRLRAAPATSASSEATLPTGSVITVSGTVSGGTWSATCPGSVTGSTWYVVSEVNGRSTSVLYGVGSVYAATGMFRRAIYLEGIDVSRYQGTISWPRVAGAGKRFVVMRATLGQTYVDPAYATNHAGAEAAGLPVAAYHFASPSGAAGDAVRQADSFVEHAALQVGDLVPALDLEQSGGLSVGALQSWVSAWLGEVYARVGVRAMIYTSPSFWASAMGDTAMFSEQGYSVLWIAHWDASSPKVPGGDWGGAGWTFWQYSNCGSVAGISGCVDLDRYDGTDLGPVTIAQISAQAGPPVPAQVDAPTLASSNSLVTWSDPVTLAVRVPVVPADPAAPTAPTAPADPATVTSADPATVTSATDGLPSGTQAPATQPAGTITLQQLPATASEWSDAGSLVPDAGGLAAFTATPAVNTQYRAVIAGASAPATTTAPVRVVVRQRLLLRPATGGAVRRGTHVTFTATVRPIASGGRTKVTFAFSRYVSGHWRAIATRSVYTDASGRARWTWTFGTSGSWYVRAMANPTATNANSAWSTPVRYTVH